MMQQVATTKSDLAAFATGTEADSFAGSNGNEQFGKLMQDQRNSDAMSVTPETSAAYAANKGRVNSGTQAEEIPPNDESVKVVTQNAEQNGVTAASVNRDQHTDNIKNDLHTDVAEAIDGDPTNLKAHVTTEPSNKVVAEQWISLVDNLMRLHEAPDNADLSLDDHQAHSLEEADIDLKLPNAITKMPFERTIDGLVGKSVDDPSQVEMEANKVSLDLAHEGKAAAELSTEQQHLSMQVGVAMCDVIDRLKIDKLSGKGVKPETIELLLERPEFLPGLNSSQQEVGQKIGTAGDVDTGLALDSVKATEASMAAQQSSTKVQVDLSAAENKALLATILIGSDTDNTKDLAKLASSPEVGDKLALAAVTSGEGLTGTIETDGIKMEILEQGIQVAQLPSSQMSGPSKGEGPTSISEVKSLSNLTDTKLDKALDNISQRLFDTKKVGEAVSAEQLVQQAVTPKAEQIVSAIESSSKEFIAGLKSGIDEFKSQLSQGREPGLDLKALVTEALTKVTDNTVSAKASTNVEQVVASVSQILSMAQSISRTVEQQHEQIYTAALRDVTQIQGEQSKQVQLNQIESKFDKAINISKPEAHQQLAEKVRWMVNTKNMVAEIRLDPAELGSMHVKVAMSGESATVNFVVHTQQARDAVDTATPRLRELLAEKGIELGQSSVRQESNGQQDPSDGQYANKNADVNGQADEMDMPEQVVAQQNIVNGALGGIDYFV